MGLNQLCSTVGQRFSLILLHRLAKTLIILDCAALARIRATFHGIDTSDAPVPGGEVFVIGHCLAASSHQVIAMPVPEPMLRTHVYD